MAKMIVVYWRDIPAQVIVKKGRKSTRVQLSERFHKAIDRAAMRAGRGGSDAYLDDWRRMQVICGDDLEKVANGTAEGLEAQYSDEDLNLLAKAGGIATTDH